MRLPTDESKKRSLYSAFAALRGNPNFETIVEGMREDLADLDQELRAAPVSEEIGKTQGRALYAADFIRLSGESRAYLDKLNNKK